MIYAHSFESELLHFPNSIFISYLLVFIGPKQQKNVRKESAQKVAGAEVVSFHLKARNTSKAPSITNNRGKHFFAGTKTISNYQIPLSGIQNEMQ